MCEGISLFQLALEKYEEMFPAFTDSRECKLLKVSNQGVFPVFQGFSPLSQHFRGHQPHLSLSLAQTPVCGGCFPWVSVPWDEMLEKGIDRNRAFPNFSWCFPRNCWKLTRSRTARPTPRQ